jgi:vacuolar-type H+-ATPase subunit I/STV1
VRIGFLKPLSRAERYSRVDRGQWTIRLVRQYPALAAPPATDTPAKAAASSPPPAAGVGQALAAELVARGVTAKAAAELVQRHPAESLQAKIDVFDWMTEKQDKRLAKSPAGYLVKSITDDYAAPKGYVSRAELERQAEAKRQAERKAAEARRRQREEEEREQAERKAIDAYWNSLTPEQQAELDADARAQADPDSLALETGPFKTMGERIRRNEHIRQLLKNRQPEPI